MVSSEDSLRLQLDAALAECKRLRQERERLCAQLSQSEDELKLRDSALNATTAHFLIADMRQPGWPMVYANRAIAADHGYEPQDLRGKGEEFLSPADPDVAAHSEIYQSMLQGKVARANIISRRKDGSTFWAGVTMAPIRDEEGRVTHYLGMGSDITARLEEQERAKQLQAQLTSEMQERERMAIELRLAQKLESVGRLAAGIAHEINTPIQYVGDSVTFAQSGHAELSELLAACLAAIDRIDAGDSPAEVLADLKSAREATDLEFLNAERPRACERTLDGIQRVADIVRAMKEFAHPGHVEQTAADINHAVQTTLTVARNEYKYSAQVETHLGELPDVVCNVSELNQVFLNLIVNAAQAVRESGKSASTGRISITTERAHDCVRIRIADNGCGIPQENLEKIFDPFFTTKEVGLGTGQGLAIARSIVVEKHGGTIDVESEPGVGTAFILNLPVEGRCTPRVAA